MNRDQTLKSYLAWLAEHTRPVSLYPIAPELLTDLDLTQLYVPLATERRIEIGRWQAMRNTTFFLDDDIVPDELRPEFDPDYALPDKAVIGIHEIIERPMPKLEYATGHWLERAFLAQEAVLAHPRLVLLGTPGSGKSCFLRHTAWSIAHQALDAGTGGEQQSTQLPIVLSLHTLAQAFARHGTGIQTINQALAATLARAGIEDSHDLLETALQQGIAILLLDRLDLVPSEAEPGMTIARRGLLSAIQQFAEYYPYTRIVITARTATSAEISELFDWPVETLAPLTLGQIRYLVPAFYRQLAAAGQLSDQQAQQSAERLIDACIRRPDLRELAGNPLLLTSLALALTREALSRKRSPLYDRLLQLLLDGWDRRRELRPLLDILQPYQLSQARLDALFDELAYEAQHMAATSGYGEIETSRMCAILQRHLIGAGQSATVSEAAVQRGVAAFAERSGLITPEPARPVYRSAYLAFQEYGASRHLVLRSADPVDMLLRHRDAAEWRIPIMLGSDLLAPTTLQHLPQRLSSPSEHGQAKERERWYRDLILASEIGEQQTWDALSSVLDTELDILQESLRYGLTTLLADAEQPLALAERIQAGFLLGRLGDPRYPVTIEQWREQLALAYAGDTTGYFCRIEPGWYWIGNPYPPQPRDAAPEERPAFTVQIASPLLIGRYPITNEQWHAAPGVVPQQNLTWLEAQSAGPNQPATNMRWQQCDEFCSWLSGELGARVRLPTEIEWEAAARGGDQRRYPWGDNWSEELAWAYETRTAYRNQWVTVPIGCFPAGAAPCGALDLAGNVHERTSNLFFDYPGEAIPAPESKQRMARGGSYAELSWRVHCMARFKHSTSRDSGFRVIVEL